MCLDPCIVLVVVRYDVRGVCMCPCLKLCRSIMLLRCQVTSGSCCDDRTVGYYCCYDEANGRRTFLAVYQRVPHIHDDADDSRRSMTMSTECLISRGGKTI